MARKIYPYLIEEQRLSGYYEILLDEKYKVKFFDKKKDKEVYDIFLPGIRNTLFWTFSVANNSAYLANKTEFNKMSNDLKAAVCGTYLCNVFEKKDSLVICFKNGICFAITDDEKEAKKLKEYEAKMEMQVINLRDEDTYRVPAKEEDIYLYILELYKMIFMNKIQKDLQNSNKFDKTRNDFVKFTEKVYNIRITDDKEKLKKIEKWEIDLDLEKTYIKIENEFDLLYKNNKLNDNKNVERWFLVLFVVAIIIGIINLWGMMQ